MLDRYMESNLIHQAGKIEDEVEQERFIKWLLNFEFNALKIPKPDHIIFLDMPPKYSILLARSRAILKNGKTQDIHEKDSQHLITAYKNGMKFAERFGWDIVHCVENGRILSIEEIGDKVLSVVLSDKNKNKNASFDM